MSVSKLTAAAIADVCARLLKGESRTSLRKRWGIGGDAIDKITDVLRQHGLTVKVQATSRIDLEQEMKLHKLFASTLDSNRIISKATGVPLTTINASRIRFNKALVQAGGDLPLCGCGQYLHHARTCEVRHRQNMRNAGTASVRTLQPADTEDVRARLLRGETVRSIAERVGLNSGHITTFLRSFTTDERHQRDAAFRVSAGRRRALALSKKIERPMAINPATDPLYARISAAVPRGIDAALRDDMISQAYLEVLEGRLKEDGFLRGVKAIRGRVFQAFANPWGNLSLNVLLGDGDGRTMIEQIPAGTSAFS